MPTIYDFLYKGFNIEEINTSLHKKESPQMVYHLTGSQKAAFAAQLLGHKQAIINT